MNILFILIKIFTIICMIKRWSIGYLILHELQYGLNLTNLNKNLYQNFHGLKVKNEIKNECRQAKRTKKKF